MAFTVRFKNRKTNAVIDVQYQAGAILPNLHDRICSPFAEQTWTTVVDVVGQVSGSPYEILVQE
jgi:hypothetical protein